MDNVGAGAAEGIRTPDPRITNAVLYQLSYRGFTGFLEGLDRNCHRFATINLAPAFSFGSHLGKGGLDDFGRLGVGVCEQMAIDPQGNGG